MARIYGGILGLLAMLTTIASGWIHGGDAESILWTGWLNMLLFCIIGLFIGAIASSTIEESVRERLAIQLAAKAEGGKKKDEG